MKTVIVIPAYNEAKTIGAVVASARSFADCVIVVDDGSSDATGEIARAEGSTVYRHVLNRGLGAALGTGIAAALRHGADIVVTFDADGQHDVRDISRLIAPLREGRADVAIGVRQRRTMPWLRIIANQCANIVTFSLYGAWSSDSQSGFRAFTRSAAMMMDCRGDRMEVSSEIIGEAARNRLKIVEVPITTVYTAYSLSKGQGFFEGLRTLERLIVRRFFR